MAQILQLVSTPGTGHGGHTGPARRPASDRPAVRVDGLGKDFRHPWTRRIKTAVESVSFEVPEGGTFGLLGPNGAGKTTTLRMLLGLLPATRGHRPRSWASRRARPRAAREVGFLPENPYFYDHLSGARVPRVLGRAGRHGPRRRARAGAHADRARRAGAARRTCRLRKYSKGMLQRAGPRARAHGTAAPAVPRRADDRPRPDRPPRGGGAGARAAARTASPSSSPATSSTTSRRCATASPSCAPAACSPRARWTTCWRTARPARSSSSCRAARWRCRRSSSAPRWRRPGRACASRCADGRSRLGARRLAGGPRPRGARAGAAAPLARGPVHGDVPRRPRRRRRARAGRRGAARGAGGRAMNAILAVARGTFREAVRDRVLFLVLVFGGAAARHVARPLADRAGRGPAHHRRPGAVRPGADRHRDRRAGRARSWCTRRSSAARSTSSCRGR